MFWSKKFQGEYRRKHQQGCKGGYQDGNGDKNAEVQNRPEAGKGKHLQAGNDGKRSPENTNVGVLKRIAASYIKRHTNIAKFVLNVQILI